MGLAHFLKSTITMFINWIKLFYAQRCWQKYYLRSNTGWWWQFSRVCSNRYNLCHSSWWEVTRDSKFYQNNSPSYKWIWGPDYNRWLGSGNCSRRYFLHQFSGHHESTYVQDQRKVFFLKRKYCISLCSTCRNKRWNYYIK